MLDDQNIISQRDPQGALEIAANQWQQAKWEAEVSNPEHDDRPIKNIVIAGMGGSALAALILKSWLEDEIKLPVEVYRTYGVPDYVDENSLVIVSSYSGNTEETLAAYSEAKYRNAQIAIVTSGGELQNLANSEDVSAIYLPSGLQPRVATIYSLRALLKVLIHFSITDESFYNEVGESSEWLKKETAHWLKDVNTAQNPAKQIALISSGKTPVFYAGHLMAPIAYKWKISWNETGKNMAFWNEIPEFNHNEFMGWTSHPIEKPFSVFDLVSDLEHPRIVRRFEVSDRILSGKRPKANIVRLQGESKIRQMLWGCILADFASTYTAILNGVNPVPVDLIEKFKKEL